VLVAVDRGGWPVKNQACHGRAWDERAAGRRTARKGETTKNAKVGRSGEDRDAGPP